MRVAVYLILRCHKAILRLYPAEFRNFFGDEIHQVFNQIVEEASGEGPTALARVVLHEIRDLPLAVIAAYRQDQTSGGNQRRTQMRPVDQFEFSKRKHWWAMKNISRFINNPIVFWTLANFIGLGAMLLLTVVIPTSVLLTRLGTTLIIFLPIGLAQWLALRRFINVSPLWIFTILIGVLLIPYLPRLLPAGLPMFADDESVLVLTTLPFLLGLIIGLPQWLALRRPVRKTILWVPASAVGLAGGLWFVLVTGLIDTPIVNIISPVLIYCITTGLVLARFLAKPNIPPAEALAAT